MDMNAVYRSAREQGCLVLCAADLWSKHGFQDGDALLNFCIDQGIFLPLDLTEGALVHLVTTHLLPATCPDTEVDIYIGSHNPIRAVEWDRAECPAELTCAFVSLTKGEVVAAIRAAIAQESSPK